jgi:uncharacterized protein YutE (UPF0331/DUF86 family)
LQESERNEFVNTVAIYGLAERYLHLSIECIINIANILIASLGWRKPGDNAEAMLILGEEGVVSQDFAQTRCAMVRFRNILVHIYLNIDRNRVYDVLQNNLSDLDRFANNVLQFLFEELNIVLFDS